jgi:Fungal specific transcription factor domain
MNTEVAMLGPDKISQVCVFSAWQASSAIVLTDVPATVDDLKTLFLRPLYQFRNSPNRKAWTVMGHLVRRAYHYGLHQVDNPTNCSLYVLEVTTPTELETWRYLWWSIYILDTCCNSTIATPSIIDFDCLCTAITSSGIESWTDVPILPQESRHFLSSDIQDLSNALRNISRDWLNNANGTYEVDINFAIRIIITSGLRQICNLLQSSNQNSAERLKNALATFIRLARRHPPCAACAVPRPEA